MPNGVSRYTELHFVGQQKIVVGGDVITPETERLFALVVRLSAPIGREVSRAALIEALWPDADGTSGRHNLRQTVYKARELGLPLEGNEESLRLAVTKCSCDWENPSQCLPGRWLGDYEPAFSSAFRTWLAGKRATIHSAMRSRLSRELQATRARGDFRHSGALAERISLIDELNEEATLVRAEILALEGAKADALRLLADYRREMSKLESGSEASLPAEILRRRISEHLSAITYRHGVGHPDKLIGRDDELTRIAGLISDSREGHGTALVLAGQPGIGKSRIVLEGRKIAALQGHTTFDFACTNSPRAAAFETLREIVARLQNAPGALGTTPLALARLNAFVQQGTHSAQTVDASDIADLFSSIAYERPFLLTLESWHAVDAESKEILLRIYRDGGQRHHALLATTDQILDPKHCFPTAGVTTHHLAPHSNCEVERILREIAGTQLPGASDDEIRLAAAFANGIPAHGVEMLALLESDQPIADIPPRARRSTDRVLDQMNKVQLRFLCLHGTAPELTYHASLAKVLQTSTEALERETQALEAAKILECSEGTFRVSGILSEAVRRRIPASQRRRDAEACAEIASRAFEESCDTRYLYSTVRLLIEARQETRARSILADHAAHLARSETLSSIAFELSRLRESARTKELADCITQTLDQVCQTLSVSDGSRRQTPRTRTPTSLPCVPLSLIEVQHTIASPLALQASLRSTYTTDVPANERLSEAVIALSLASNNGALAELEAAYNAVQNLRHAPAISAYDVARADLIYCATKGRREDALDYARSLAEASREVADINLSCQGLRNAAEVMLHYSEISGAIKLLLESHERATQMQYPKQVAWSCLALADAFVEQMDLISAQGYLERATTTIQVAELSEPLFSLDLNLVHFWYALASDDKNAMRKYSKQFELSFARAKHAGTTARLAAAAVKLATCERAGSHATLADLRASIISLPYFRNEHFALAACVLYANAHGISEDVADFVRSRIELSRAHERHVWPFLASLT